MSMPFFIFSVRKGVLGRVGAAWYIPTGAAVETRGGVETWPACQPITQAAAPEARADPPPQEGSQEHADGPRRSSPPIADTIPARPRPMQTAADAPCPDQQAATQTAGHRRRTETPRRPRQAPTWANYPQRQQTRPERPETQQTTQRAV